MRSNKAFQTDEFAVSHLLQKAQKLRHNNFAAEQRRYASWSSMSKYSIFLAVLVSKLLFASQYVPAETSAIRFESTVEDPNVMVVVDAKLGAAKPARFASIEISYLDSTISVPEAVLSLAPNPLVHSLRLAYCGQTSAQKIEHPCLLLLMDYGDLDEKSGMHSSLSIEIFEGRISGYTNAVVTDGAVSEEFVESDA